MDCTEAIRLKPDDADAQDILEKIRQKQGDKEL
jgi:hypothetical protein